MFRLRQRARGRPRCLHLRVWAQCRRRQLNRGLGVPVCALEANLVQPFFDASERFSMTRRSLGRCHPRSRTTRSRASRGSRRRLVIGSGHAHRLSVVARPGTASLPMPPPLPKAVHSAASVRFWCLTRVCSWQLTGLMLHHSSSYGLQRRPEYRRWCDADRLP